MQDETTTDESLDAQAGQTAPEPKDQENTAADNQAEVTSHPSESDKSEPQGDNSDEAEIKEWAAKKGVNLEDPIALAKLARETEKSFHAKSGEVSALKKAVGAQTSEADEGSVESEAYPIINRLRVAEFYNEHPEAKDYDEQMAQIVEEKPYLAQDLEVLFDVARSRSAATETLKARQEGRKEALDIQAKAQQAGAPKAAPTGKPQTAGKYTSADIEKMSLKEYQELKDSGFNPYTDIAD